MYPNKRILVCLFTCISSGTEDLILLPVAACLSNRIKCHRHTCCLHYHDVRIEQCGTSRYLFWRLKSALQVILVLSSRLLSLRRLTPVWPVTTSPLATPYHVPLYHPVERALSSTWMTPTRSDVVVVVTSYYWHNHATPERFRTSTTGLAPTTIIDAKDIGFVLLHSITHSVAQMDGRSLRAIVDGRYAGEKDSCLTAPIQTQWMIQKTSLKSQISFYNYRSSCNLFDKKCSQE